MSTTNNQTTTTRGIVQNRLYGLKADLETHDSVESIEIFDTSRLPTLRVQLKSVGQGTRAIPEDVIMQIYGADLAVRSSQRGSITVGPFLEGER